MNEYPDYLNPDVPTRVDWWWTEEGRMEALAAAEVRGAQAVLAAVEELHYTVDDEWCQHDGFSWPCSTVRDAAAAAAGGGGAPCCDHPKCPGGSLCCCQEAER